MTGASYSYLLDVFQDAQERAELLDLGHRLGLEPNAPEWAQLALAEFHTRRIAAAAGHLEAQARSLVNSLDANARAVATELAAKAREAGAQVHEGAADATKTALDAALPRFIADASGSLRKAASEAIGELAKARNDHLSAAARMERSISRLSWTRVCAIVAMTLAIGVGSGWWFTVGHPTSNIHAEVCADLGRRSASVIEYLRSRGYGTAADAAASRSAALDRDCP